MFERFTDRARRVIVLAQEEAVTMRHSFIGDDHLLLALIAEGESIAAQALAKWTDVDLAAARGVVAKRLGIGSASPAHIPFTDQTKETLEQTLREAVKLGHNYIGPEHLLLAMLQSASVNAAHVLHRFGYTPSLRGELGDQIYAVPRSAEVVASPPAIGGPRAVKPYRGRGEVAIDQSDRCTPGEHVTFIGGGHVIRGVITRRRRNHRRGIVAIWIDGQITSDATAPIEGRGDKRFTAPGSAWETQPTTPPLTSGAQLVVGTFLSIEVPASKPRDEA